LILLALAALLVLGLAILVYALWRRNRLARPTKTPFADIPVQTARISTRDGKWDIRYHKSGRGPYMLLLHGIGANLFCWRRLIPLLNAQYTVVALDLPGFGASSKLPGAAYGLDEQSDRLAAFCAALGIGKFYLAGNSMGGNIALWHAAQFPGQCLGCVVIAPATSPRLFPIDPAPFLWLAQPLSYIVSRQAMRWAHRRTVSKKDLVDRDRVEETYLTYGRNPEAIRSFLAASESIRDPRLGQRLREIKARVLILWGSEDNLVSRDVIDALESALAAEESKVHIGGGHHLQEDEPEWTAEKIRSFFST
jgi:abhydrolase domain-containing protein 6